MDYAIWRSCERFGILPPGVESKWDNNDWWSQSCIIAYDQVRQHEEIELAGYQTAHKGF